MRMMFPLALIVSLLLISSCSSIINGRTQEISIHSNVDGADVVLNGYNLGTTPVNRVTIKREEKYHLIVKKDGYKEYSSVLHTKFDKWFWGNIVIGGVIGSTTDALTGTTHLLDPNTLYVKLAPLKEESVLKDKSKEDSTLKDFLMTSYSQLKRDINTGNGDYLHSLMKMLNYKDKKELLRKLKAILELQDSIPGFVSEVMKLKKNEVQ